MSNLRKSILAFIAGVCFLVLTPWLHQKPKTQQALILPHQLNALVRQVHWVEFDETGKLAQEFFAPEIKSLPHPQGYYIDHPYLKLRQNTEHIEIQSHHAQVAQNSNSIQLQEQVQIQRFNQNQEQISTITTDSLHYDPKQKLAETTTVVNFLFKDSAFQSQGLKVFFEHEKSIHLSKVDGHFNPKKYKK